MKKYFVAVLMSLASFNLLENEGFAQEGWQGTMHLTDRNEPEDRIGQLEAELASLKSRLDGASSLSGRNCSRCWTDDCGDLRTGLNGGYELLWLKPHFADDTAFVISDFASFNSLPFDNQFEPASRVWLAHTWESGFGGRLRYWNYDKNAVERELTVPAGFDAEARVALNDSQGFNAFMDGDVGEIMLARHGLELHTADWEVTNQFCLLSSQVIVSGGIRYMSLRNDYSVLAIEPDGDIAESLLHNQRFQGAGPVLAVDVNRTLGDSGLSLFFNLRGSIVFGDASQDVIDTAGANVTSFRQVDSDKSIAIGELGMGLRYSVGPWFLQGGWEGQIWTDAGGPTRNTGDIGIHGFSLALGFNR